MLAQAGKVANVPVIYGTNADEGTIFNPCPKNLSATDYNTYLLKQCVTLSLFVDGVPCGVFVCVPVRSHECACVCVHAYECASVC